MYIKMNYFILVLYIVLFSGIYETIINFVTISLGFFVLNLCLSELVGIVPFSGGNFGFVRCALGPFWGFMAAAMEFLYYCMFNARNFIKIALLVEAAGEFHISLEPLWAFLGVVFLLLINVRGGLTFWVFMMLVTLFTFAVLMIFFIGAYSHFDFYGYAMGQKYGEELHNDGTIGNGTRYLNYVARMTLFYMGLEILPLCSLRVKNESHVIPRAMMTGFGIMFVVAALTILGVACHYPGVQPVLAEAKFILQYGLQDAVSIDEKYYPLLLLPPTVASSAGYLFAAGNQMAAMAESGMLPSFLRPRMGADQVPVVAMIACGVIQYVVYYFFHYFEPDVVILPSNIWSLAAPALFTLVCVSFIAFRLKYPTMERSFVSPLGIPGAVYGILLWVFVFIRSSDRRFQPNNRAITTFYCFVAIAFVYYFVYVRYFQCFSPEEQKKFMRAYILNANQRRRKSAIVKTMPSLTLWRNSTEIGINLRSSGTNFNNLAFISTSSKEKSAGSTLTTGDSNYLSSGYDNIQVDPYGTEFTTRKPTGMESRDVSNFKPFYLFEKNEEVNYHHTDEFMR